MVFLPLMGNAYIVDTDVKIIKEKKARNLNDINHYPSVESVRHDT